MFVNRARAMMGGAVCAVILGLGGQARANPEDDASLGWVDPVVDGRMSGPVIGITFIIG